MIFALKLLNAIVVGVALSVLTTLLIVTPSESWDVIPVTAIGAALAASLASLSGLAVSETVAQRRQADAERALRSHRERVYEELLQHMVSIFEEADKRQAGSQRSSEAQIRATIAVWGNSVIVDLLGDWNRWTGRIMRESGGSVLPNQQGQLEEHVATVARAIREDLSNLDAGGEVPSKEAIARMIFNDYGDQPNEDEI